MKDESGEVMIGLVPVKYEFKADFFSKDGKPSTYPAPHVEFRSDGPNALTETGYRSWFISWDLAEFGSAKEMIDKFLEMELKAKMKTHTLRHGILMPVQKEEVWLIRALNGNAVRLRCKEDLAFSYGKKAKRDEDGTKEIFVDYLKDQHDIMRSLVDRKIQHVLLEGEKVKQMNLNGQIQIEKPNIAPELTESQKEIAEEMKRLDGELDRKEDELKCLEEMEELKLKLENLEQNKGGKYHSDLPYSQPAIQDRREWMAKNRPALVEKAKELKELSDLVVAIHTRNGEAWYGGSDYGFGVYWGRKPES